MKKTNLSIEWISIKIEMPENGEAVLVYETYPEGTVRNAAVFPLQGFPNKVAQYRAYDNVFLDIMRDSLKYVTHWMPLPKPPLP